MNHDVGVFTRRRIISPAESYFAAPAAAVPAGYTAEGIHLNGSTILNASSLTGLADGQKGILSFWFKYTGGDGSFQLLIETRDQTSFVMYRDNTNHLNLSMLNTSAGSAMSWTSTATFTSAMSWTHFLSSWDFSGAGTASVYLTDTVANVPSSSGTTTINYLATDTNWDFGARTGLAIPSTMDIADFYLNTVEFLDFGTSSNRRKFISAGLAPVDLGSNGSTPTTNAPMIYLHGPLASWQTNDGTGGGFSVVSGALTASATNPP